MKSILQMLIQLSPLKNKLKDGQERKKKHYSEMIGKRSAG